jgi:hypothetical protein
MEIMSVNIHHDSSFVFEGESRYYYILNVKLLIFYVYSLCETKLKRKSKTENPAFNIAMECSCHIRLFGVILEDSIAHAKVTINQSDGGEGSYGANANLTLDLTQKSIMDSGRPDNMQAHLDCWMITNKNYISQRVVSTHPCLKLSQFTLSVAGNPHDPLHDGVLSRA